jgi:hypothetical protein
MPLADWLERHQRRLPGLAGAIGRARKAFSRMDLRSLEQLCAYSSAELLRVPWIGPGTVAVLEELLAEDGLRLRDRR